MGMVLWSCRSHGLHACATLSLCNDLPSPCIRYLIETTRLSISLCACWAGEPRGCHGNTKVHRSGGEPRRRECVGDCRAKTWWANIKRTPYSKADMDTANAKRHLFNMLDRFPPCNPEHGKSMAKVQQTAGKEHGKDMVILPCSPLFVLLPVRREPMSVQRTALPMRGGL